MELALRLQARQGKGQLGAKMVALGRVVGPGVPGVEGQQLGVYQEEGMAHFIPATLGTGIDVLHHLSLQELDALLTQLRVDQPLHGLGCRGGKAAELPQTQPCSPRGRSELPLLQAAALQPRPTAFSHTLGLHAASHPWSTPKVRDTPERWHLHCKALVLLPQVAVGLQQAPQEAPHALPLLRIGRT